MASRPPDLIQASTFRREDSGPFFGSIDKLLERLRCYSHIHDSVNAIRVCTRAASDILSTVDTVISMVSSDSTVSMLEVNVLTGKENFEATGTAKGRNLHLIVSSHRRVDVRLKE